MASGAPGINQEKALLDYAERIGRNRTDRVAVQVHLSRLQSQNRKDHHIRVAVSTFDELIQRFEGAVFLLTNQDIMFVCRGAEIEVLQNTLLRLRYLFSEDPLTRFADESDDSGFVSWFMLETEYDRFLALVKRFVELSDAQSADAAKVKSRSRAARKPPMTAAHLAQLEKTLMSADLAALVRQQAVCAITPTEKAHAVFHELFVSIGDLERLLLPGHSITADRWLFQYLTQTLDKRMMHQVLRDYAGADRAFSLNINVGTVLSEEFQKFDKGISATLRGKLVVEFQKIDLFSDMGAYFFARDYLRERGYKICLDGLTHMVLPFIDRAKMGIDLMKVYWSEDIVENIRGKTAQQVRQIIRQAGAGRIILTRCDDDKAVRLGHEMGISLFQGRYVDKMLQAGKPLEQMTKTRPQAANA